MKLAAWFTGLAGLVVLIVLMVHEGFGEVVHTLSLAGWALLWLVPFHAVPLLLDAQGWRTLLVPTDRARRATLPFLFWVAAVREAVTRLLPSVGVGGEVVGIRLAALRLADTSAVTATIIVEVLLTLVVQYVFSALGIVLILHATQSVNSAWVMMTGLLLSLPVPIAVVWLLRHGTVFERLEALVRRLFGDASRLVARLDGARLDADVHRLFTQPRRLLVALAWQFSGYLLGAFETWLALRLLGHPVSVGASIGIEALTQASRHLMFMVPGGLGVQEASVLLFAGMAGIGGEAALSLSLAKRLREVLFSVPALMSWQWVEARQLRRAVALRKVPEGLNSSL